MVINSALDFSIDLLSNLSIYLKKVKIFYGYYFLKHNICSIIENIFK